MMNRWALVFVAVLAGLANSGCAGIASGTIGSTPVAPSITTAPASQTVTAGQTASFIVAAAGTAPLAYQWKKNGVAISGATSARDRKSTRLNSSHLVISYAVFCLKK